MTSGTAHSLVYALRCVYMSTVLVLHVSAIRILMSFISIVGNQDDVITELGWIFSMIGICEGVCPVLATCRRSLDSQNVIEDAMQQNDSRQTTTPPASHAATASATVVTNKAVRLRTNASTTATTQDKSDNDDKGSSDEESVTESSSNGGSSNSNSNANAEAAALLLAAYREHVGPGLKVM